MKETQFKWPEKKRDKKKESWYHGVLQLLGTLNLALHAVYGKKTEYSLWTGS